MGKGNLLEFNIDKNKIRHLFAVSPSTEFCWLEHITASLSIMFNSLGAGTHRVYNFLKLISIIGRKY